MAVKPNTNGDLEVDLRFLTKKRVFLNILALAILLIISLKVPFISATLLFIGYVGSTIGALVVLWSAVSYIMDGFKFETSSVTYIGEYSDVGKQLILSTLLALTYICIGHVALGVLSLISLVGGGIIIFKKLADQDRSKGN